MNRAKLGSLRARLMLGIAVAACALLSPPPIAAADTVADTVMLSWTSVPEAEGYKIYVFPGANGSSLYTIDVGSVGADLHGVVRHSVEITDPGADSFVAVTAYNATGAESELSNRKSLPEAPATLSVHLEQQP